MEKQARTLWASSNKLSFPGFTICSSGIDCMPECDIVCTRRCTVAADGSIPHTDVLLSHISSCGGCNCGALAVLRLLPGPTRCAPGCQQQVVVPRAERPGLPGRPDDPRSTARRDMSSIAGRRCSRTERCNDIYRGQQGALGRGRFVRHMIATNLQFNHPPTSVATLPAMFVC